ncbi:hypothetical protein HELRODRAFT_174940 [Helobdella robusta]|uniref:Uncharacterized protein n=1 Tax=Helobdella robusta TaxID=6412 RepID=T1F8N0_HELRO|nr:hypothetical protein HELRODRAFT_174940 [Helobdella robusta]ESO01385.1 hypothetical protein HELRODRAFT_174940 [Helobdella robusta]
MMKNYLQLTTNLHERKECYSLNLLSKAVSLSFGLSQKIDESTEFREQGLKLKLQKMISGGSLNCLCDVYTRLKTLEKFWSCSQREIQLSERGHGQKLTTYHYLVEECNSLYRIESLLTFYGLYIYRLINNLYLRHYFCGTYHENKKMY